MARAQAPVREDVRAFDQRHQPSLGRKYLGRGPRSRGAGVHRRHRRGLESLVFGTIWRPDDFVSLLGKEPSMSGVNAGSGLQAAQKLKSRLAARALKQRGLRYVSTDELTIRRKRNGAGYTFVSARGQTIRDQ